MSRAISYESINSKSSGNGNVPRGTMGEPVENDRRPFAEMLFRKRLDRCGFVVLDVEDGVKLRDLEQVVNFLG